MPPCYPRLICHLLLFAIASNPLRPLNLPTQTTLSAPAIGASATQYDSLTALYSYLRDAFGPVSLFKVTTRQDGSEHVLAVQPVQPVLGKEGDPHPDIRTSTIAHFGTIDYAGYQLLTNVAVAQDNAGKTTLLYRLKVRPPVHRADLLLP